VTSQFRSLEVLAAVSQRYASRVAPHLGNTGIVCVQHLLETTGSLLEALLTLGVEPSNVHVLGKAYSTNPDVATRLRRLGVSVSNGTLPTHPGHFSEAVRDDLLKLWDSATSLRSGAIDTLVVVDDGGRCLTSVPEWCAAIPSVVGIEQTQFGMARLPYERFPVVLVARSAAKMYVEAPMIARAIAGRAASSLAATLGTHRRGVVGAGHIGSALLAEFQRNGFDVSVYDPVLSGHTLPGIKKYASLYRLVRDTDVLFGCTGVDIFGTQVVDEEWFSRCRVLASCSSEDVEFQSLLRMYGVPVVDRVAHVVSDVNCLIGARGITVLRGGYPVNFDGTPDSVPAEDIQLTRGLLLGAIFQAVLLSKAQARCEPVMLAPEIQQVVCEAWFAGDPRRELGYPTKLRRGVRRTDWLEGQSEGTRRRI
jgi:hypothetical protein